MARLFVAIRPPRAIREALLGATGGIEGARWQDDGQLHLTLAFAGEVDGARTDDLIEALAGVESAVFPAEVAGIGHFERKGVPTAVWAGVQLSDPLAQLQRRVERACHRAGLTLERRTYRPHITLARMRRTAAPVGDWLAKHGTLRAGPWDVEGFTLFESQLRPEGPLYSALVDYEF
ncbi:MAG: RNA 2',3'-cyclic phosphodiesterase [Croceibacterium sp.]